jgi:hypothetical protein
MSYTSVKIEPLGKDNFDTWKIQIEALLIKNDSWKYVNGTIPKPKEQPEAVTTWESNDAKAWSDLILTICPSELKQIKNCPTSKDIWNKLHSVYQSQGPARKAMLLKTLILLKMKNGEDMRDHIRNFFDVASWTNSKRWNFVSSMTFLPSFCSTAFPTSMNLFELP